MDNDVESPSIDEDGGGGAWESVGPAGKKGSKGKKGNKGKMKNARTLSLQTFFSEHGGGSEEGSEMMEEPELTPEEILARESLLTYFSDLIRRSGPMKVNGPQIRTHLEDRMTDGESLLSGKAVVEIEQMPNFLSSSPDLIIVDDVVCDKRHGQSAKIQALERVLANFAALSSENSLKQPAAALHRPGSSASSSPGPVPPPLGMPTPAPNVWTKGPPGASPAAPDPLLQLPSRVESLFNGGGHHSGFGGIVPSQSPARASPSSNVGTTNLPDLSSPPPPLPPLTTGTSITSNSITGRGHMDTSCSDMDLSRTLNRVTAYNTELLESLKDTERKNTALKAHVALLEDQLEEARDEIARLTGGGGEAADSGSVAIFSLKKELESERLNSANLKRQLEMEQQLGKSVQEKHSSLLGKLHAMAASDVVAGGAGQPAGGASSAFGSPFANSFGFGSGFSSTTNTSQPSASSVLADFGITSTTSQSKLFNNPPPPQPPSTTASSSVGAQRLQLLDQHNLRTTDLYKQFGRLGS